MPEEIVTGTPESTPAPTAPASSATPAPAPAPAGNQAGDWEREKRGLIGENQKERAARQKLEAQHTKLHTEHELAVRRIQALSGVNPKSQSDQEDEEIRAAFAQKYPHLADLTPEDIQALRDGRQTLAALKASQDAIWNKHTTQVMNSIHEKVADALGGSVDQLTPKQKATLRREYISFIEENQAAGKDFITRHENGDEALFEEFVKDYLGEWQEPIRRSVTSTEINRQRPLPSGKGRSVATTVPKKIDFKNEKEVENRAVEVFKSLGGSFGN